MVFNRNSSRLSLWAQQTAALWVFTMTSFLSYFILFTYEQLSMVCEREEKREQNDSFGENYKTRKHTGTGVEWMSMFFWTRKSSFSYWKTKKKKENFRLFPLDMSQSSIPPESSISCAFALTIHDVHVVLFLGLLSYSQHSLSPTLSNELFRDQELFTFCVCFFLCCSCSYRTVRIVNCVVWINHIMSEWERELKINSFNIELDSHCVILEISSCRHRVNLDFHFLLAQ